MKRKLVLLAAVLVCTCGSALGWGRDGHAAIAYIAECNLTPRAKKTVVKILGNRSIVYYASWLDNIRYTPEYRVTSSWHGNRVDSLGEYLPAEGGDALACVEECIARLKDYRHLDDSTVVVSVRYLIHLVGDMHCPTHIKFPWYKDFDFDLNGTPARFHAFWDSGVLAMNHPWSYTEYASQLDRATKVERNAIAAGTPREWLRESAEDCRMIYTLCAPGQKFSKAQTAAFGVAARPLAEQQIVRSGYRLARILNELFD